MSLSFSFIFVFYIFPAVLLISAIWSFVRDQIKTKQLFHIGVLYLKNLRVLLMHIQEHRGLSNSYLNGNIAVEAEVKNLENLIADDIASVNAVSGWAPNHTKWESILDHWTRVVINYKLNNAEINLKQHNSLISSLLYFIDDLVYEHHLGKLNIVDDNDTDWRNLLFLAEYIGQVRALGMGAVSKGTCSNVLRIQLNHVCLNIKANINQYWPSEIKTDFLYFLDVVEHQVEVEVTTISPEDYFKLASRCIEHVLREFDRQVEKIQMFDQ